MFDNLINALAIKVFVLLGKRSLRQLDRFAEDARNINESLLFKLLKESRDTEYGRKYGLASIKTVDDFRKQVPFSEYDDYAPYIERMTNDGEKNLLTGRDIVHYAQTSGSIGVPKYIPVSKEGMDIYLGYGPSRVFALADQWHVKNKSGHLKHALCLNTLECPDITTMKDGTPRGNISGSAAKQKIGFFKYFCTSPKQVLMPQGKMDIKYFKIRYALMDKDLLCIFSTFMSNISDIMMYTEKNWPMICDDIEKGTINDSVDVEEPVRKALEAELKPDPERANELRAEFEKGFGNIMERIWPNLSFLSAIGTGGFSGYAAKVRDYSGSIPFDYSVYAASESLMAAARKIEVPEFTLLPEGAFYEFIPANIPEDKIDSTKTLLIDELEPGKEYEIILTNLSGFYRYRIMDVIEVLGYQGKSPLITFSYRKKQMLNLIGEKTSEQHVSATMEMFSKETGVTVLDYVVYADDSKEPGCYVFIIEPKETIDKTGLDEYSDVIDNILREVSFEYEEARSLNEISHCVLYLQQPETHYLWRDMRLYFGASTNQVKPVRLLDSPVKKKFFTKLLM